MKFDKFIRNKSVIFVGPASINIGRGLGEWIDSFDVVVRSNGAILLLNNPDYIKDYGKRCDILYANVQFHREMKPLPLQEWKQKYNLKFLGMKTGKKELLKKYSQVIPTFHVGDIIGELQGKLKGLLYGDVIVKHLSMHGPKELWFTGIDFYYTKPDIFIPDDYREYFPDYLPKKIQEKANKMNLNKVDPHDQWSNTKFFWDLIQEGKIKTHDFIIDIMKEIINNPDYYNYEAKLKRVGKK